MSSAITGVNPADLATAADASARIPTKTLTQTDFLKVMVAQLSQQDPEKAADSSKFFEDFMNMGNFQAMQDVDISMQRVYGAQQQMLAQSLVGRTVEVGDDETGEQVTGVITGSYIKDTDVMITVNGNDYKTSSIIQLLQDVANSTNVDSSTDTNN